MPLYSLSDGSGLITLYHLDEDVAALECGVIEDEKTMLVAVIASRGWIWVLF